MRNIILLFFLSVTYGMAAAQSRTDSLYSLLDEAIANSDRYVEKREGYIRHTRGMYANAGMAARYSLALELYKEYSAYMSDSALVWLERAATIARRLGDGAGENRCRVLKAYLCSSTGMYTEAVDMLASVRKEKLSGAGLLDYYMSCSHLYGELAYYTKVDELRKKYLAMSRLYSDTLIAIAPADNDYRLLALEKRAYDEGDYAKALSYNDRRMRLAAKGSHGMAIVAFYRYLDYKMLGDNERWNYWLAVSALNDVRNAVMDQGALWELANAMYIKGDLLRSYRYINFASDCAARFGTRLRYLQITPVIANVDKMWQMRGRRENAWLKTVIAVSAGFLVIVLSLLFYLMRQRRRLTQTKSELSRKNEQLLTLNSEMKQTLTDLDTANRHLVAAGDRLNEAVANLDESNRVKEKYIGLFLRQCSSYIDRMDSMRVDTLSMLKAKRYADLLQTVKNHNFRDRERDELLEIFDSTFIGLFPTFVDEFNMLLRPDCRIVPDDMSRLTTGIRIFALIRLGIDDSSKIAEFLHFSVNTIYNYRAKIKNGAAVSRDEFEDYVRAIGLPTD